MALVRISAKLINDVDDRITKIANKAAESTVAPLRLSENKEFKNELIDLAVSSLWGEHLHLKDQIPKEWYSFTERLDVRLMDADGRRIGEEVQIVHKAACPPNKTRGYGYVEVDVPIDRTSEGLRALMARYDAAKTAHKDKYFQVRTQVRAFLHNCKSLNDALKKFPDIGLYIPQEYQDRVNTVVARSAGKQEEEPVSVTVDRDLIISTGVLGKMQS